MHATEWIAHIRRFDIEIDAGLSRRAVRASLEANHKVQQRNYEYIPHMRWFSRRLHTPTPQAQLTATIPTAVACINQAHYRHRHRHRHRRLISSQSACACALDASEKKQQRNSFLCLVLLTVFVALVLLYLSLCCVKCSLRSIESTLGNYACVRAREPQASPFITKPIGIKKNGTL